MPTAATVKNSDRLDSLLLVGWLRNGMRSDGNAIAVNRRGDAEGRGQAEPDPIPRSAGEDQSPFLPGWLPGRSGSDRETCRASRRAIQASRATPSSRLPHKLQRCQSIATRVALSPASR